MCSTALGETFCFLLGGGAVSWLEEEDSRIGGMTTATFEDGSPESLRLLFSISTVIVSGGEGMLRIERRVCLGCVF
jgi:hypothetical protein